MPTITANTSTQVSLPAGSYLNGTGAGQAFAAGSVDPLTNGDAWQIGPFGTTQTVHITAYTAISYEVKTLAASPPAVLSTSEVAATQALVSTPGNITAAELATTSGTPGQIVRVSDGDDLGALLVWAIPAGASAYAWCYWLSPADAY